MNMFNILFFSAFLYGAYSEVLTNEVALRRGLLLEKGQNILAQPKKSNLPEFFVQYGEHGVNYFFDEWKRPYILCEYYNSEECPKDQSVEHCSRLKRCYAETRSHELRCMAAFVFNGTDPVNFTNSPIIVTNEYNVTGNNDTTPITIQEINGSFWYTDANAVRKDCWSQSATELTDCDTKDRCIAEHRATGDRESTAMFCCCSTHKCNQNTLYRKILKPKEEATTIFMSKADEIFDGLTLASMLLSILFFCVCLACCFSFYVLRRKWLLDHQGKKKKKFGEIYNANFNGKKSGNLYYDDNVAMGDEEYIALIGGCKVDLWNLTMGKMVANGRFGQVYKATAGDIALAVKIFPIADVDSWICEQDLYSIEALRSHPNISTFVSAFPRDKSFWLLTLYCEQGSLHDYLKRNILSLHGLGRIASSMLNGLAFLHEESRTPFSPKPSIVHRDIKSKNILVKDDLTTCITDFGLALKCETRRVAPDEAHGQVGTRRYMSPELLEGAMEFSSFAFRQTDVYAASLVIWELLSRTRLAYETDEHVDDYALPFEVEIGHPPSLGEIRDLVVIQKYRPQIRESLFKNEFTNAIIKTMVEMWDKEPDARITSGCARDRMIRITEAITRYYNIHNDFHVEETDSMNDDIHSINDETIADQGKQHFFGNNIPLANDAPKNIASRRVELSDQSYPYFSSNSPSTTTTSAATTALCYDEYPIQHRSN